MPPARDRFAALFGPARRRDLQDDDTSVGYFHYGGSANTRGPPLRWCAVTGAPLFELDDLHVRVAGVPNAPEILRGVDLVVRAGEVHALMGPNGSGKSTLANTLLGNPEYEVTAGRIRFKGGDITDWATDVRGKAGIFLAFQYPQTIAGVSVLNFLRQALSARKGIDLSILELRLAIMEWMDRLGMDAAFLDRLNLDATFGQRSVNEGFSGGEKKRHEIAQMELLNPGMAILDETDSGLDIDALKIVSEGVNRFRAQEGKAVLLITHYTRILRYIQPDYVHVFVNGRIADQGGPELADELEASGYDKYLKAAAV